MEGDRTISPEALLVVDGKIRKTGSEKELRSLAPAKTNFVDLQGKTLMPGFVEPHTHADLSVFLYKMVDLSPYANQTQEEIWRRLRHAVRDAQPGEWIVAKGLDPDQMQDLDLPDREYLDSLAPKNPLYILSQTLHSAWANSIAFEKAGITAHTTTPSTDSYFEKDESGRLTGYIHEVEAVKMMNPVISDQVDIVANAQQALAGFREDGITTIATMGLFGIEEGALDLFQYFSATTLPLKLRIAEFFGLLPDRSPTVRHFVYFLADDRDLLPDIQGEDDSFKVLGVKFWADGSMLEAAKGHRAQTYETNKFRQMIKEVHDAGWQIAVHANEAWAINETLDHIRAANDGNPRENHRHRIEHAAYLSFPAARKSKAAGVTISFQLNTLHYYADFLPRYVEPQVLSGLAAVKTAHDANLVYSLHSDAPAFPQSPLQLVEIAVTRMAKSGEVIGDDQAIAVYDALKAVTINAAWQLNMDKKIGSISKGKYADFVILSRNPLKTPLSEISKIEITGVYLNGNQIR